MFITEIGYPLSFLVFWRKH